MHPVEARIEDIEWGSAEFYTATSSMPPLVRMEVMICHADYQKLDPTQPIFIYQEDQ